MGPRADRLDSPAANAPVCATSRPPGGVALSLTLSNQVKTTMKTLSLRFIALAGAMSLSACGDDDPVGPFGNAALPATPRPRVADAGASAPANPDSPAPADAGAPAVPTPSAPDARVVGPPVSTPAAIPPGSLAVGERPESAQFDPVSNAWYVSVQAKADVPGDGYIAKLNADATAFVSERFVTGLNEPKGVRIH